MKNTTLGNNTKFDYDVAVIGLGRVGLPLSLSMASKGIKVIGVDINQSLIDDVNHKIFPFREEGYDELIKQVEFVATTEYDVLKQSQNIIITVGTPLMNHIETDLSHILDVLNKLLPYLQPNHHLILRSTIAPGTTTFVKDFIEQNSELKLGDNFFMTFCPERMAEGKSMVEIETLPQIIGSQDEKSAQLAQDFFERFVLEVLHTDFISAELVKLFNNISRYVYFSTANQFAIIADQYGANIHNVIEMSNYKYPRGVIPKPGFTAGTCLRKDFGMINESIPFTDLLLSAWKVNEFMPKFLVDGAKKRTSLKAKKIGVLGYTFKEDVDDIRDSLVPKLVRYLVRENPKQILIHDPNLTNIIDGIYQNYSLSDTLNNIDILILAIPHREFKENINTILNSLKDDVLIIDLWNVTKVGGVFINKSDLEGMRASNNFSLAVQSK